MSKIDIRDIVADICDYYGLLPPTVLVNVSTGLLVPWLPEQPACQPIESGRRLVGFRCSDTGRLFQCEGQMSSEDRTRLQEAVAGRYACPQADFRFGRPSRVARDVRRGVLTTENANRLSSSWRSCS